MKPIVLVILGIAALLFLFSCDDKKNDDITQSVNTNGSVETAVQVEHHLKSGRREKEGDGWVSVSAAKLAHGAAGAQTLPLAAGAEEQLARPSPSASTRGPAARQS